MRELEKLQEYLRVSIQRNGDKSLTLSHLANLIGVMLREEEKVQKEDDDIYNEIVDDLHKWGN